MVSPVGQLRLVRRAAEPFAGRTLEAANGDVEAGLVIVGIERDGTFRTDPTTPIEDDDRVVVAGTDATVRELEREVA
ncbi:TrkA C-terminal domain-containing protein [Halopiger djelfimassiliensis]|uniref:TrkA C-terminal domain-containing protein n=1 Tax=Halopiger djelfimassiliensis TaxID=1293047 RepID=UPI00373FCEB6